jgi:signal transduction histidine kinase
MPVMIWDADHDLGRPSAVGRRKGFNAMRISAMRISIRLRTIVAVNSIVLLIALSFGWVSRDVAASIVEERLAREMTRSVATFLAGNSFPMSDVMMTRLRELLDQDWVAIRKSDHQVLGSSLSDVATSEFVRSVGARSAEAHSVGAPIRVEAVNYRVEHHDVVATAAGPDFPMGDVQRLYVLIPEARINDARQFASSRVAKAVLPLTAVATLLAVGLAFGVVRPIHRLTHEINRMAGDPHCDPAGSSIPPNPAARESLISTGPTETRRLASSFYQLLDRLEATQRGLARNEQLAAIGKLCLSVAHELRNPLSGIKMNIRVLKDQFGLENDAGINAVIRETDRMALYLDELMRFAPGSVAPAGSPPVGDGSEHRISTKLSSLAESVLTILAGRCEHARIVIRKDFPKHEPCVRANRNQIRQVMMNLLVNAIEAMPNGGVVTLSIQSHPGGVKFTVNDTGDDVIPTDVDIFEPFTTTKPDGTGLGLYLSSQIITHHGGNIGYETHAHGTSFWFELNAEADPSPANESARPELAPMRA